MEPIVIVKKRSRIWLIMIAVIIAMLLVAAALWFMGDGAATNITRISQTGTHASALFQGMGLTCFRLSAGSSQGGPEGSASTTGRT